jgi:hypothetical protein
MAPPPKWGFKSTSNWSNSGAFGLMANGRLEMGVSELAMQTEPDWDTFQSSKSTRPDHNMRTRPHFSY